MDDEAKQVARGALSLASVVGGFVFVRLAVETVNEYLRFAAPHSQPNPITHEFPPPTWVALQVVVVLLAFVIGGVIASLPS